MPNIAITPKFTPFTYEELARPLVEATKYQMALEDQYNAMEMEAAKWERLAESNVDQDSYQKYKSYANALKEASNELMANGLNPQSRQALYGLRTRFNEDIFPMQEAYNWRQKQAEIQQKAMMEDPSYIWERQAQDIPLSEIINNPSMTLNGVSGEKIRKSYGEAVKNLKTSWAENPVIQSLEAKYPNLMPEIGGFLQEIETTGITREELDNFISNYNEEDRGDINLAIQSLINAIEPIRELYNIDKFNGNETIENAFEGAIKLGAYDSLGANKDSIFKGNDPNAGKKGNSGGVVVEGPTLQYDNKLYQLRSKEDIEEINNNMSYISEITSDLIKNYDNINSPEINRYAEAKDMIKYLEGFKAVSATGDQDLLNRYFYEISNFGNSTLLNKLKSVNPLNSEEKQISSETNNRLSEMTDIANAEDYLKALTELDNNYGKAYSKAVSDNTKNTLPNGVDATYERKDIDLSKLSKEELEAFNEAFNTWRESGDRNGDAGLFGLVRVPMSKSDLQELWEDSIDDGADIVQLVADTSDSKKAHLKTENIERLDRKDLKVEDNDTFKFYFGEHGYTLSKTNDDKTLTIVPYMPSNFRTAFETLNQLKQEALNIYCGTKDAQDKATAKTTMKLADKNMLHLIVLSRQQVDAQKYTINNKKEYFNSNNINNVNEE